MGSRRKRRKRRRRRRKKRRMGLVARSNLLKTRRLTRNGTNAKTMRRTKRKKR